MASEGTNKKPTRMDGQTIEHEQCEANGPSTRGLQWGPLNYGHFCFARGCLDSPRGPVPLPVLGTPKYRKQKIRGPLILGDRNLLYFHG